MRGIEASAKIMVSKELMLKIGSCVLDVLDNDNTKSLINLTIEDALLLRELAQSSVKYGTEHVGLSLKKKLYEVLDAMYNKTTDSSFSSTVLEKLDAANNNDSNQS